MSSAALPSPIASAAVFRRAIVPSAARARDHRLDFVPAASSETSSLASAEAKVAGALFSPTEPDAIFEGYASLFGRLDLGRDIVLPGAFAESIARRGAAGIRMLWQHEAREPIGVWDEIREDARGLFVRGRLTLAVARAREVFALLAGGALDGLSIGFLPEIAARDRANGIRRLQRVDLWEISLVTFPMLPGARVTRFRGPTPCADIAPERKLLRALHRARAALHTSLGA